MFLEKTFQPGLSKDDRDILLKNARSVYAFFGRHIPGTIILIDDFLSQSRVSSKGFTQSSQHRALIAYEQMELCRVAAESLPLSPYSRRLNRLVSAKAEIHYGLAKIRNGSFFSGFQNIFHGLVRCPMLL